MGKQKDFHSNKIAEYGYLIHLLRCGIYGQVPMEPSEDLSLETVFQVAMEHDVANLAFYAIEKLEKKPENGLFDKWKLRRDLALVRDMNQSFARQELVEGWNAQGIPFKELQGTKLKELYPSPEYRTMSDLDFIVEPSRLTECGNILENLGYICKACGDYEINGIRRPDILVELHTDYFSPHSDYYRIMGEPFSCESQSEAEKLTELYLYTVLHTAKHYFASGCGIRRVLDMYFLDLYYGDIVDREYIDSILHKANVKVFADEFLSLAREWFGQQDSLRNTKAMENYVFQAGLHGKRENYISGRIQQMEKGGTISFGAKVKYLFSRLFPGDRVMLNQYPVLKKWRILYPVCWILRIFKMLLGKNREASVLDLKLIFRTNSEQHLTADHRKEK